MDYKFSCENCKIEVLSSSKYVDLKCSKCGSNLGFNDSNSLRYAGGHVIINGESHYVSYGIIKFE